MVSRHSGARWIDSKWGGARLAPAQVIDANDWLQRNVHCKDSHLEVAVNKAQIYSNWIKNNIFVIKAITEPKLVNNLVNKFI